MKIILLFFILLFVLSEYYAYQAVKIAFQEKKAVLYFYFFFTLILYSYLGYLIVNLKGPQNTFVFQRIILLSTIIITSKSFIGFSLLAEDMVRFFHYLYQIATGGSSVASMSGRRKFVSQLALAASSIPIAGIIYGVLYGKYNYRVEKLQLKFKDLPTKFDGYKILQISDIHVGSFDDKEKVAYGIDLINKQKADLVLFTGDMVNNIADEMQDWKELFSKIKAPDGVFSVLGNHDYGDYYKWDRAEQKKENLKKLETIQAEIGYKILKNEHINITKEDQSISILGVENWGEKPFPQYGDLEKAVKGIPNDQFCVLMSHDPTHFDRKVKNHPKKIHLTLSGHTHGMQFGINIPGFLQWSPVSFKYPKWMGLYEENERYLYVNRGFGYIGFPGRLGMWPEITVIELKKG